MGQIALIKTYFFTLAFSIENYRHLPFLSFGKKSSRDRKKLTNQLSEILIELVSYENHNRIE
jgi:hypothetical protein